MNPLLARFEPMYTRNSGPYDQGYWVWRSALFDDSPGGHFLPMELYEALPPDAAGDGPDRFAELWYATRDDAIEALLEAVRTLEVDL